MVAGLDRLLRDERRLAHLRSTRVAVLANPASMTSVPLGFQRALDALVARLGKTVSAGFGPQHGMRGDKQYNMEESPSALFKAVRTVQPDFELWWDFPYEYEPRHRLPIDVINGASVGGRCSGVDRRLGWGASPR